MNEGDCPAKTLISSERTLIIIQDRSENNWRVL